MVARSVHISNKNSWLKAQTISERLDALRRTTGALPNYDAEKARKRLKSWKALSGFRNYPARFNRRLEFLQCSEDEFLQILGTSPEELTPSESTPQWLNEILKSERRYQNPICLKSLSKYIDRGLIVPFLPLIDRSCKRLIDEIKGDERLSRGNQTAPDLVDVLLRPFLQSFEHNVRRCVVLEVNSHRVLGKLQSETPSERYKEFVERFNSRRCRLAFLKKYPVLARYSQRAMDQWLNTSREFLFNLSSDSKELHDCFQIDEQDPLAFMRRSGDSHNNGRAVATLTFESGRKIMYKPRNLEIDKCFQAFLQWCNDNGAPCNQRLIKIISHPDHGWAEYVQRCNTENALEFKEFYFRLGALIAVLYSIEAVDIYFENLVAAGTHPVIVDLETLFHPPLGRIAPISAAEQVRKLIDRSVMSIGILPKPSHSKGGESTFDISGIGASVDQIAPYTVVGIEKFGRDDIAITSIPGWIPSAHNRPIDNPAQRIPSDAVLQGFLETYDFIQKNKNLLLSKNGPLCNFRPCNRRLIVRDTKRYGSLQQDEFHPDLLRDDIDRSWHWDNLWGDAIQRPIVEQFVESEFNQLQLNDIPHFTVRVDGTAVSGADGSVILANETISGWAAARKRIESMSTQDKQLQAWFMQASLGLADSVQLPSFSEQAQRDLLKIACSIGDEVLRNLIWHDGCASFLSVINLHNEDNNSREANVIRDAGLNLYDGLGGVVLFLAYLANESFNVKYTFAAKALLKNLEYRYNEGGAIGGIGGFTGIGSLVYLYTHLAVIWKDPAMFTRAEQCLSAIDSIIAQDQSLDVLGGAAGCILSVLPLVAQRPYSKAKKIAIRCADHLLDEGGKKGEPRWMSLRYKRGFSHGFSGVAVALHRLAQVTVSRRYALAAEELIAREDELTSDGRWTDSHQLNGRCQVSWCHGAPGIALARLKMYESEQSFQFRESTERALQETRGSYWMNSHCLCHGTVGNLEPLLVASKYREFAVYTQEMEDQLQSVLAEIARDGWKSLSPSQTLSTGLMTGLCGVGYGLLRFHNVNKVPSVLTLEGPSTTRDFDYSLFDALRNQLKSAWS